MHPFDPHLPTRREATTHRAPTLSLTHVLMRPHLSQQRWGDAPVHSIGAALFARRDQIHFFDEIGYHHPPFKHCPRSTHVQRQKNCACKRYESFGGCSLYSFPSCAFTRLPPPRTADYSRTSPRRRPGSNRCPLSNWAMEMVMI